MVSLNYWLKTFIKLSIFCALIFFLIINKLYAENTRLLLISHLYPIIDDQKKSSLLFKQINSENVNSVFILGDSSIHKKKIYSVFKKQIKHDLYFIPGNEEISYKKEYLENVGYLNKVLNFENFKIIMLNSSARLEDIKKYLNKELQKNKKKSNFIFTHFRIWDDALISDSQEQHNKSYYYDELKPFIEKRIKAVFAGDSKRYYFSDLTQQDSFGKQNLNLIYWVDQIDNINFYSIGSGDSFPNVNYVILEINNLTGEYKVLPKKKAISLAEHKLLDGKYYNLTYRPTKTITQRILLLFIDKKFYAGIIFTLFLILIILIFSKKSFFKK